MSISKFKSTEIETAAVCIQGTRYQLLYNEKFIDSLTNEEQESVLMHEVGHIMYGHCLFYNDLTHRDIANIAMDAEINFYLKGLPSNVVDARKIKEKWSEFQFEQGSRYNYRFLCDKLKHQSNKNGIGINGDGNCSQSNDIEDLGNIIDDHSRMSDVGNLSDAEKEVLKSTTEGIIKFAAKQAGKVPGEFSDIIDIINKKSIPVFNWKKYLRCLIGQSEITTRKLTRKRPSKRFDDAVGSKLKRLCRLLVAVDTSGSVSKEELSEIFGEIYHIYKAGAVVDVLQFDTKINNIEKYKPQDLVKCIGRGGTDFRAPVDHFNKSRQYDMLIMITDGYDDINQLHIRQNKCIWIITDNTNIKNYPGYTVYFQNK